MLIPEGRSSGWLVPDIYRDRFDIQVGDAKVLLPKLVDRLDNIDLFFHELRSHLQPHDFRIRAGETKACTERRDHCR